MHKTNISEKDSGHREISPAMDAYSRAAATPLTDADAYRRMYYRRFMRLGYEARRYQIDRREIEVRGGKAEIRRLEDEYMQVLLSLRSEAQVLLSLRSETVEDAVRDSDDKSGVRYFDDEIQALLTLCLHTLPLDTLLTVPKGHFWADLTIMFSETASETGRLEAMERLFSNYFKVPIHPFRWRAIGHLVIREIARAASANKISYGEEFRCRERSSLYVIAQGAVKNIPLRQQEGAIRAVGRALNNAFTEDVLGSDWSKKPKQEELRDGVDGKQNKKLSQTEMLRKSSEAKILRKVELSLIPKRSDLTEREAELISLKRRGFSYEELAAKLQASPGALRTAHHRAIEKLKKLVS